MKKLFVKLFGRKEIKTLGDVVERVDWATKEIEDAEVKLVELAHRLHDGIVELGVAEKSSADIVARHLAIQEKAKNRKSEFQAKSQKVQDLINTIAKEVK